MRRTIINTVDILVLLLVVLVVLLKNKVFSAFLLHPDHVRISFLVVFLIPTCLIFTVLWEHKRMFKFLARRVKFEKDVHTRLTALKSALIENRTDMSLRTIIWRQMTDNRLIDHLLNDSDIEKDLLGYGDMFVYERLELHKLRELREEEKEKPSPNTD